MLYIFEQRTNYYDLYYSPLKRSPKSWWTFCRPTVEAIVLESKAVGRILQMTEQYRNRRNYFHMNERTFAHAHFYAHELTHNQTHTHKYTRTHMHTHTLTSTHTNSSWTHTRTPIQTHI